MMSIDGIETEAEFSAHAERHRRELQVHCYRMLASYEEAEDAVQEALLRAWRHRSTYAGKASLRAWLYRIATNTCLDAIARDPRRKKPAPESGTAVEFPWLQPFPDHLLDEIADEAAGPATALVEKETIELAFLVAIQHLPPKQRAVLILRDVLSWSAKETAELLDISVAAANSALQRARATMQETLPQQRSEWGTTTDPTEAEREVLQRYLETQERGDPDALAAILREDVRFSMPPQPEVYIGRETLREFTRPFLEPTGAEYMGELRGLVVHANRMPGTAFYVKSPGDDTYRPLALDMLRIEHGEVAEITTFEPRLFPLFGLPATLEP
jgi:RNA polymerase sigma-70 factor (ECF subfamily)